MEDDWKEILDRAETAPLTSNDIRTLAAIIGANQTIAASGRQAVVLGGGANESVLLTGNSNQVSKQVFNIEQGIVNFIIPQSFDSGLLQTLLQNLPAELQSFSANTTEVGPEPFETKPLALSIEPEMVDVINSRLTAIQELYNAGQLTKTQEAEFNRLKLKIHSLQELNQQLEQLAANFDQVLKDALLSLESRLKELSSSREESLLEVSSQVCLREQIEILMKFQEQLNYGAIAAHWLNRMRAQQLAQTLGEYALSIYPLAKANASPRRLEAFYFTLEQFLERLSHCLVWGRTNNLDNALIPVVLDDEVYIAAFEQLRSKIPFPSPHDGFEQLKEYLDYLIENIPRYRHISID